MRAASNVPPSGSTIDSPTFTGTGDLTGLTALKGGEWVIYESGIPFIGLSSGSVSAGGAISGITALPIAYPNAYCWFPANILAASIAAGWYYCTFSTTTAGTAFLNTYTSGIPTIPASPTAVTAGQGAFTGATTELFGPTITIPANAVGANGSIVFEFLSRFTNSVGNKTTTLRYSGNAGTLLVNNALTTQLGEFGRGRIWNRGATNVQTANVMRWDESGTGRNSGPTAIAIDTTASSTLVFGQTRAAATDNFVFDGVSASIRRGS